MPDYPDVFWVLAVVSVISVGIAKAGFGGGVGVIATPLLALVIPVTDAAALMLPILITCDVFAVLHYRRSFDRRSVSHLLPGAIFGIAMGAAFFSYFATNERMLQIGLGILAVLFVVFQVIRVLFLGLIEKRHPGVTEGVIMGAVSAFTSTLAHAGGPPATIYLLPQKLPRHIYVGTTVIFFACLNQGKLIPYVGMGLLRFDHLSTIAILAPLCYAGVRLGIFLNTRFPEVWFNRIVYTVLLITGVQLIAGRSLVAMAAG